jgi:hypothetical protein
MISPTPSLIRTTTPAGLPVIKTIFEWDAKWVDFEGNLVETRSHCLLRLYIDPHRSTAIVIASELYSNRNAHNLDVSRSFGELALTVLQTFGEELKLKKEPIFWVAHYGRFTSPRSYENLHDRDEFRQIVLQERESGWLAKSGENLLDIADLEKLLSGTLESVEQALIELDAGDLSEWTKVDVEKHLAESRQRWERANSSNAAN